MKVGRKWVVVYDADQNAFLISCSPQAVTCAQAQQMFAKSEQLHDQLAKKVVNCDRRG
jgi:hypothetical protein